MDRDRYAGLGRDRRSRAPTRRCQAGSPPDRRGRVHPFACRSFRRRRRLDHAGAGANRQSSGDRAEGVPRLGSERERHRRAGHATPRRLSIRCEPQAKRRRAGHIGHRPGPGDWNQFADRPHPGDRAHRRNPDHRRGAPYVPDDARHRSAGGDEHRLPGLADRRSGGKRERHPAQHSDAARRARARREGLGRWTDRIPRAVRRQRHPHHESRLAAVRTTGDRRLSRQAPGR